MDGNCAESASSSTITIQPAKFWAILIPTFGQLSQADSLNPGVEGLSGHNPTSIQVTTNIVHPLTEEPGARLFSPSNSAVMNQFHPGTAEDAGHFEVSDLFAELRPNEFEWLMPSAREIIEENLP